MRVLTAVQDASLPDTVALCPLIVTVGVRTISSVVNVKVSSSPSLAKLLSKVLLDTIETTSSVGGVWSYLTLLPSVVLIT